MRNAYFLLTGLLLGASQTLHAQQAVVTECGTEITLTPQQLQQMKAASENAQLRGPQQTTKIIPVVVHVIHNNTPGTNISREKILDGMRMLNEDFNKQNPDTALVVPAFKNLIADVQVEFRLATLDPDGNCTQGITRTYSPLTMSANDNVKSLVQWDPSKYLNIWVAGNLSSGAGAYSAFPCGNPALDGIVTRADRIGFTYSHTVSHEVGHYFGLQHVWGPGPVGQPGSCSQDDGVADTPNTIGGSTPVCNLNQYHCGNLVNIQNIMDYGGCLTMFTLGQKAVMQNALASPCRNNLWSQSNLIATGTADTSPIVTCPPTPDFIASRTRICQGEALQLLDLSYNTTFDSTFTWLWTLTGPDTFTFTTQNPTVTLANPGNYAVSLTVSNSAGDSTLTRTGYLQVMATTTALQVPFSESFERPEFPAFAGNPILNWTHESNTTQTWERVSTAAADSSHSMRIRHNFIPQNQQNALLTPNINLAGIAEPTLEFKVAYMPSNSNPSAVDMLKVLTSDNCGQTWTQRYVKTSTALATAPAAPGLFVPDASQWRTETVSLPASSPYLMLKFESTSGVGNALYLDAVRVYDAATVSAPELEPLQNLEVYPNPSFGQATLRYQLLQKTEVYLRILSATGAEVVSKTLTQESGKHELELKPLTGKLPAGIYLVQLSSGNAIRTVKLAVQ